MTITHTLKPLMAIALLILSGIVCPTTLRAQQLKSLHLSKNDTVNRVILKGHVSVEIVQRKQTGIQYKEDNTGSARVVLRDRTLTIQASGPQICKMVLYVDNIYRLEAEGNARITTFGSLKVPFLQVFLKDQTSADMEISCKELYTKIADSAQLNLAGDTQMHHLCRGNQTILTLNHFAANQTLTIPLEMKQGIVQAVVGK